MMKTTLTFDGENNLDVSELSNKGNVETHTNTHKHKADLSHSMVVLISKFRLTQVC